MKRLPWCAGILTIIASSASAQILVPPPVRVPSMQDSTSHPASILQTIIGLQQTSQELLLEIRAKQTRLNEVREDSLSREQQALQVRESMQLDSMIAADSSNRQKITQWLQRLRGAIGGIDIGSGAEGFLPVLGEQSAEKFWQQGKVRALSSAAIVGEPDFLGATVEFFSGILGPIRLGVGTVVVTSDEDTTDKATADSLNRESETFNRLLQNGGTLHLTGSWPILFATWKDGRVMWNAILRGSGGWDVPAINQFADSGGAVGMLSLETSAHGIATNGQIGLETGLLWQRFVLNGDVAARLATTDRYAGYVGWRVGVVLFRSTRLGAIITLDDSGLMRNKIRTRFYVQQVDLR